MFKERDIPSAHLSKNSTWCKSPLSAAQEGNSSDRQLLVYRHSPGSKPAVTDVAHDVQRGRDTHVLHQPQPESY